ncbi:Uma2 family endonuclease [Streptomyces sp. GXMU-J15]|uniref:Uma2 family endonuclease n=1 Tax=Streptomyces fuscus TaxID=3048495 RepID=A0ABT7J4U6_9ACTN|nr:Uma2 family endonuclease [Streptomyces fuscus]MDL2079334.1 Uma2 family endonuclease [Streptomyces fuscus]
MTHHDPITQKLLLDWFVGLEMPKGLKAELLEGEFAATPVPDGQHEHCVSRIVEQVTEHSATKMQFAANKGLKLGSAEGCLPDHVIPDGTFARKKRRLFRGADPWMPCEGVTMVLEVTNRSSERDCATKRRCYARAGIPLYLLVNRETKWITLLRSPKPDDYQELHAVALGNPLPLPKPFSFDLETRDFL